MKEARPVTTAQPSSPDVHSRPPGSLRQELVFLHMAIAEQPDCGTTSPGHKGFGRRIGWIGGWGLAVSAIIVLADVAKVVIPRGH